MFNKFGSLFCAALLLTLVGCSGDKGSDSKDKKTSAAASDEPTWTLFATDAPKIEIDDSTEVPPLDNGRLNIKVLDGWKETNQKRPGMLFIFLKGGKPTPSLLIHKPDDVKGDVKELDDTSKSGYLTSYTAELPDADKKYFVDKPKFIDINGRPWIAYRVAKNSGGNKIDVTYLSTVANGRKYTLELRTADKKANHDWPALLSMANGMSFGGKPAEPTTPDDTKKPDAAKPDTEKTEPAKDAAEKEPAAEK